jgi:L-lactate dehydrogenase complex protein LldG
VISGCQKLYYFYAANFKQGGHPVDEKQISAIELFKRKAAGVKTIVVEAQDLNGAYDYALGLCEKKEPCKLLFPGQEEKYGTPQVKIVSVPDVPEKDFPAFAAKGEAKGFRVIRDKLQNYIAGIDVSFNPVEFVIAETASAVLVCPKEDSRLSAMISEISVLTVPKSKIFKTLYETEELLRGLMLDTMYVSFISASSRTADIERVLALGVHGPLELHVALLEG